MKKAKTIILIIAFVIIGLGIVTTGFLLGTGKFFTEPTPTPTPTLTKTPTQIPSPSPSTTTPAVSATPTIATSSENVTVTKPSPYSEITSPLHIEGTARVFENLVSIRLKNSTGVTLASTTTNASAPDVGQFGPYSAYLTFPVQTGSGTLEVFSSSAINGSEVNMVSIPIKFK